MGLNLLETGGGDWLPEGRFVVRIAKQKSITANSGSRGVEYEFVEDSTGRRTKGSYWTYAKDGAVNNGAWRLRVLSEAAGLDEDSMRDFQPGMLLGFTVGVIVKQDDNGKYHSVQGEFAPDSESSPAPDTEEVQGTPDDEPNDPDTAENEWDHDLDDSVPF